MDGKNITQWEKYITDYNANPAKYPNGYIYRKGARANDFEMAIQWLVNAGLLYKVPRCTKPELPLDIYEAVSYTHLRNLYFSGHSSFPM